MLLLSPKTSKEGPAAFMQENSSMAPQSTSCPSSAHSHQLTQAVTSHPSVHMAPAICPAQDTTTTKDTEPGFEATHRDDRLAACSRNGTKSSPRSGSGKADNSMRTAQMSLVSGVAKVAEGSCTVGIVLYGSGFLDSWKWDGWESFAASKLLPDKMPPR